MDTIFIEQRKKITIKGATKMNSSTTTQAVVEIGNDQVVISGSNIEVTKLDLEGKEVVLTGTFNAIKYAAKTEKVGLLKRLFK